jgi:uncharacterized protein
MIVEDQSDVIAFLDKPESYQEYLPVSAGYSVTRIDTHGAAVFLVGAHAFKMKRAVYFEYMDFSTIERRKLCCQAELTHNRRTSPEIYKKVVAIVRLPSGELAFGKDGDVVEWLVEMNRFDENQVFDRKAIRGDLDAGLVSQTADMICDFFEQIDVRSEPGICDTIPEIVEETARQLMDGVPDVFSQSEVNTLIDGQRRISKSLLDDLDRRRRDGFVRLCHGDLHLRNICLFDNRPMLFDAIEFNDRLAISDVLYDLAFLLMDLLHRNLKPHANLILNRYLERTGDDDGLVLLALYLSVRAGIRSFTAIPAAASQTDRQVADRVRSGAREYLELSTSFLKETGPVLVGIGGLSGSGKSTVAKDLAPELPGPVGAVVLRSDVIRKTMLGFQPTETLGPEGYTPGVTGKVYDCLLNRASAILASGHSVIVDAVQARENERSALANIAADQDIPFFGIWLETPPSIMSERIEARTNDASDADTRVLAMQLDFDTGPVSWSRVDSSGTRELTLKVVKGLISTET